MTLTTIFQGPHGFVTDFGEPLELFSTVDRTVTILPRYGVWRFDGGRGKYQVTMTTDDRDVAIEAARATGL